MWPLMVLLLAATGLLKLAKLPTGPAGLAALLPALAAAAWLPG
jgi:hypothetical protein